MAVIRVNEATRKKINALIKKRNKVSRFKNTQESIVSEAIDLLENKEKDR